MACLPTKTSGELEFVHAMCTRTRPFAECRGPLLRVVLWPFRVFTLEHIFDLQQASDTLWDGYCEDSPAGVLFELCGAHWIDLVTLCGLRARLCKRPDWNSEARHLLDDVCAAAAWDVKEIANMFAWQRERLT